MSILSDVSETFKNFPIGKVLSRKDIINEVINKYGLNPTSIIPSDYCYNRINKGSSKLNIFEFLGNGVYKYLGENFKYSGKIFCKPSDGYNEEIAGEWKDGLITLYSKSEAIQDVKLTKQSLYENANCFSLEDLVKKSNAYKLKNVVGKQLNLKDNIGITELWESNNEEDWNNSLAAYWNLVSEENFIVEKKFEALNANKVKMYTVEQFYDFLYSEYYIWKYTAKNRLKTTRTQLERYKSENRMNELEKIHNELFSFNLNDISRGIEISKRIMGLGTAGASGLLANLYPMHFATVDQFVVKALSSIKNLPERSILEGMNLESLTLRDGVILIKIMKYKADELNRKFNTTKWTPRNIDKVLWSIDR